MFLRIISIHHYKMSVAAALAELVSYLLLNLAALIMFLCVCVFVEFSQHLSMAQPSSPSLEAPLIVLLVKAKQLTGK